MNCKFVVYNVPWEKRKELLQHECVGLQERLLSCKRSQPVKAAGLVQNDVKEMFDKVQCTKCMEKCFRGPCTCTLFRPRVLEFNAQSLLSGIFNHMF